MTTLKTKNCLSRGADISFLSQFAGEDEVLFPPCTLMQVRPARPSAGAEAAAHARSARRLCGSSTLVWLLAGARG